MPYKSGVSVTAGPCPSRGVAVPQGWLDSLGAQIKAFGKACGALPGQSGAAGTQPSVPQVVEVSLILWAGVLGQEILGPPGSPEGLCRLVPALQGVVGAHGALQGEPGAVLGLCWAPLAPGERLRCPCTAGTVPWAGARWFSLAGQGGAEGAGGSHPH